jgi:pimeloyl-ACP methyl ester carboxylesterase
LYNRREGAPLQIQCHGYRSHPVRDFSGGGVSALKSGCNLCLIYQRAHGESEGRTICFGAKEREDLVLWVNYFTERLGKEVPIVLVGISMGAATVLLTSEMELPPSVKGVIADCPYSRACDIIKLVAKRMGFPSGMVYPFIRLGGLIFGRFDIEKAAPIDAIGRSRLPILLIHGEDDGFVPKAMSDALHAEAKRTGRRIRYLTFPGADHGMSYIVDTDRYEGEIRSFLRETVGNFTNE